MLLIRIETASVDSVQTARICCKTISTSHIAKEHHWDQRVHDRTPKKRQEKTTHPHHFWWILQTLHPDPPQFAVNPI